MGSTYRRIVESLTGTLGNEKCERYFLSSKETSVGDGFRAFLYLFGVAYCFIGLSAITARFFRSMENVVKQTREVVHIDPITNTETIRHEKVWNYTIADITLLALGTSFPQISLATIDAIRNLVQIYAGGLGPGTLVGSAAFDLFPIHAVYIGVWLVELFWSFWAYIWLYIILEVWTPNVITLWEALLTVLQFGLLLVHAYVQDKRYPYVSLPFARSDRPEDWVPEEANASKDCKQDDDDAGYMEYSEILGVEENRNIVDIFSIHSKNPTGLEYQNVSTDDIGESSCENSGKKSIVEDPHLLSLWGQQFLDALTMESIESRKLDSIYLRLPRISWQLLLSPLMQRVIKKRKKRKILLLFAFVPPCSLCHGWIAFICSLCFISGIAYVVTVFSDLISCVTGINPYVIAFTVLASGTSWPDLVASKIAAERQTTADSAIANITCSNSVNIYVGIGIPWLIDTTYNFIAYREPLRIQNAEGLSFSLLIFILTSICFIGLSWGGPRIWAWLTSAYFMFPWLVFVVLSSLKVSGFF
ncbi:hypothetical protein MKX01_017567 [Papaver californicum]|nr:hypothetical protein MKX01_017567 [Papaver californicum]